MTQLAEPKDATSASLPTIGHWIGGHPVAGRSGRRGPVFDPATGAQAKWVDFASVEEIDAAVAAAKAAFPAWRATSLSKRTEILFRIRNLVDHHRRDIAALLTAEHGKVPSDALGEVARGLENLEFACGVPHLLKGGFSEQASTGVDVYQIRQPLGVVAGITPFNFPAMVPDVDVRQRASRAATRSSSSRPRRTRPPRCSSPSSCARPACPRACSTSSRATRSRSTRSSSTRTSRPCRSSARRPIARYIYETGTRNGKRVQALGGAKNHMLVLPDADVEMAADAAVSAGYGSSGERCMAIATVVAVGDVADPLVDAIAARLPKIQVGPGTDPKAEMGPLVTQQHRDKVASYLDSATEQGATVVADGREHPLYRGSGLLPGCVADRQRRARDGRVPRRDLRARADGRPRRVVRGGAAAHQRQPVRQRDGDLHPRRRGGPAVPVRRQRGHGRHQRAGPGAGRLLQLRRLEVVAVRRPATCTGPRASSSTRAARSSPRAGRTRAPRRSTSASRGPADTRA